MSVTDAYRKIARAYKRGTGTRLTADEVWSLCTLDDAVSQVVTRINEGWDDEEVQTGERAEEAQP